MWSAIHHPKLMAFVRVIRARGSVRAERPRSAGLVRSVCGNRQRVWTRDGDPSEKPNRFSSADALRGADATAARAEGTSHSRPPAEVGLLRTDRDVLPAQSSARFSIGGSLAARGRVSPL